MKDRIAKPSDSELDFWQSLELYSANCALMVMKECRGCHNQRNRHQLEQLTVSH
jgi:hypothetical protein